MLGGPSRDAEVVRRDNPRAPSAGGSRTDFPVGGKVDLEERLILKYVRKTRRPRNGIAITGRGPWILFCATPASSAATARRSISASTGGGSPRSSRGSRRKLA